MNREVMIRAITGLDEEIVAGVLQERFNQWTNNDSFKTGTKRSAVCKQRHLKLHMVASAAAFVVSVGAFLLLAPQIKRPDNPDTISGVTDPSSTEEPNLHPGISEIPTTSTPPGYIQAFDTPDLEELYSTEPFDRLLPRRILDQCVFQSSYLTKYDPIAHSDDNSYLSLVFEIDGNPMYHLEIKVSRYDGGVLADPANPETYDLEYYYEHSSNPDFVGADLPNFSGMFKAEDITPEVVHARVFAFAEDDTCKAEIALICGERLVSYFYYGERISGEDFYDMIVSAEYFR